jgi:hypothetical protein
MSDIKFNEFKKVKLDTFNAEVTDPSKRDGFNIINGETNIDDKLWGVRENASDNPVSQLWLGGKKYGEVNPKQEHKLPYYYPKDNTNYQYKYTPDFLMVEDIYVVDTPEDFEKCKSITVETPNIKDEWQQYCENASMCDYGVGYSITKDKHIGIYTVTGTTKNINEDTFFGSGYGLWSSTIDYDITNPKNSCDFNGFINPNKTNKFSYTTIIGTNSGKTTGDWGGVLLMDDSNAHPRNFTCVDNDGKEYTFKRNSLYDLTDNTGVCNSTLTDSEGNTLWCAWVNDLGNGSAQVVYTKQIEDTSCGSWGFNYQTYYYGKYVDHIPTTGETVNLYFIKNNKTKTDRLNYNDLNKSVTVTNTQEAYGYVVTLNVLAQTSNDIHGLHYSGITYKNEIGSLATKGTIQVFAEVWPCDGKFYKSRVENATEIDQCHFVLGDMLGRFSGNLFEEDFNSFYCLPDGKTPYMKGTKLVPYKDYNDLSNKDGYYGFIRVDVNFDNGKLTLKFSDCVKGNKSNFDVNTLFSETNLETGNLKLNGSELTIDFNSDKYSLKSYDTYTGVDKIEEKYFNTLINSAITIDVKDSDGNSVTETVNVIDSFKKSTKFGFQQWSFQNLYYKCIGFSLEDRLILNLMDNSVYLYDYLLGDYVKEEGKVPTTYFTGSHISYNDETNKLWYSNGTEITQISTNCECFNEDDFITESMISITYEELKNLKNENSLIPGMQYRITDYVTTVNPSISDVQSAGHVFDIIVEATDVDKLSENAKAVQSVRDTDGYFAEVNLDAWELKYSLDNDTDKYAWADPYGKGVIYWLKDEWNNECPYDFKNIQFKRIAISNIDATGITSDMLTELRTTFVYDNNGGICYGQVYELPSNVLNHACEINYTFDNTIVNYYYTFTWVDENNVVQDASIVGQQLTNSEGQYSGVFNNQIQPVSQYTFYVDSPNEFGYSLNDIVFVSSYSFNYGVFYGYYGNKFGLDCCYNTFGNYCYYNTFGNLCWGNTFGNYCHSNTFGNTCSRNTFGNFCNRNTFGNDCYYNTFGKDCYYNTLVNYCYYNIFGNYCYYNTFGNYCGNNTFGNSCSSNTFGNYYHRNTFGDYCHSNTFGNVCNRNTFGNYFQYNTFGNNCIYNIFTNDYIYSFTLDDGVEYCTVSGITTAPDSLLKNYHFLSNVTSYTLPYGSPSNINYQLVVGRKSDGTIIMVNPMDYLITSINV